MHNALAMLIFSRALRSAALAALIFPVISVSAHAQGNAADEIERFIFVRRAREAQKKETRDPSARSSSARRRKNDRGAARAFCSTPEERFHCRSDATFPSDAAVEILKMMLDHGCQIDAKDKNGETLLDYAAEFGNAKAVRVLLERGADASALSPAAKRGIESRAQIREVFREFENRRASGCAAVSAN